MATIKGYARTLWNTQQTVHRKLGTDVRSAALPLRAVVLANCVVMGGVLRLLFVKNVATDAEMDAVLASIRSSAFPELQPEVPVPDDTGEIPAPDLGAE